MGLVNQNPNEKYGCGTWLVLSGLFAVGAIVAAVLGVFDALW